MKKTTFSLNYRKPKAQYKDYEELIVCIRYYYKIENAERSKIKKISTGVKCRIMDWDKDWHKKLSRNPIKDTDPDHVKKNKLLKMQS